jgi:hypothetical protein
MISLTTKSQKISAAVLLLAVILGAYAGTFLFRPLVVVGDWKIYKKDVQFRDQIILLNFPEEKRSMGLYQLAKSAINLAILQNNGVNISDAQIEEELSRIDAKTKNPEQLMKIKQIFNDDIEAYKKDFVLPALVDSMIYFEFFLKDPKVQEASLNEVAKFIGEAQKPNTDFKTLALKWNLPIQKLVVSLKNGLTWTNPESAKSKRPLPGRPEKMKVLNQNNKNQALLDRVNAHLRLDGAPKNTEDAKKWYDSVIQPMTPGQVTSTPLSQDERWLVAHYLGKNAKGDFELDIVAFNKINYSQWYEREKAKVHIVVHDKSRAMP